MIGIRGIAKKPIIDATAGTGDVKRGKIFYNNSGRKIGTYQPSVSSLETNVRISIKKGSYPNPSSYASNSTRINSLSRTILDYTEGIGILTTGIMNTGNPTTSTYWDVINYNPDGIILEYNYPRNTTYCTEIKIPHSSEYPYTTIPLELYVNVSITHFSSDLFNFYGGDSRTPVKILVLQSKKKILIVGDGSEEDMHITADSYIDCKFI